MINDQIRWNLTSVGNSLGGGGSPRALGRWKMTPNRVQETDGGVR